MIFLEHQLACACLCVDSLLRKECEMVYIVQSHVPITSEPAISIYMNNIVFVWLEDVHGHK